MLLFFLTACTDLLSKWPIFDSGDTAGCNSDTANPLQYLDNDGDGYGSGDPVTDLQILCNGNNHFALTNDDCDDTNANIHPRAVELCNGIDDNCNKFIDEPDAVNAPNLTTFYKDFDGDGFGDPMTYAIACFAPTYPAQFVLDNTDCNDLNKDVNPNATEVCNTLDDDCDKLTDDADGTLDTSTTTEWYADVDADGYGDSSSSIQKCAQPVGFVDRFDDCNDADSDIHPDAPEPDCSDPHNVNTIDYNCDGATCATK